MAGLLERLQRPPIEPPILVDRNKDRYLYYAVGTYGFVDGRPTKWLGCGPFSYPESASNQLITVQERLDALQVSFFAFFCQYFVEGLLSRAYCLVVLVGG